MSGVFPPYDSVLPVTDSAGHITAHNNLGVSIPRGPWGSLQPVTNRQVFPEQNLYTTTATYTSITFRSRHVIQENCPWVIVVWANKCYPETVVGNAVTYKAAFDYVPAGAASLNSIVVNPITLQGGQSTVTVPYGGILQSDPIFGPFKKGDSILIRTYVSVASVGMKWPLGMTLNWGWEGTATGDATATANFSLSFTAGNTGVSPAAILGPVYNRPSVGICGDSINDGAGDSGPGPFNNLGPVTRAIEGQFGSIKVASPGDRVGSCVAFNTYSGRGLFLSQCRNIVDNYGTNDLNNGDSLATIQANLITFWQMWTGRNVFRQTIDPKTTSTDTWMTIANQTQYSYESIRQALNTWIRAGCPMVNGVAVAVGTAGALIAGQPGHPLKGIIDTASMVEVNASNVLTLNGGYWMVNGTANWPTSDGTHNSANTSALKAAAVNTAVFI